MDISVIICCYNSESRIGPTLLSIAQQVLASEVSVEVILVDNNCSDQTVAVAEATWRNQAWPLKVVKEPVPGLSSARDTGCREASGTFLLFCDDDNWLCQNYLSIAYDFMEQNPDFGAIGGWGEIVSNAEVPDWFPDFETKYACGKTRIEGEVDTLVGAGLFLRKTAIQQLGASGYKPLLTDRKGEALTSGGDLELCLALRLAGWRLYYSEELQFKHFMPSGRLEEAYLLRMCEGHGRSRSILGEYRRVLKRPGTMSCLCYTISFSLRLLLRVAKGRIFGLVGQSGGSLRQRVDSATNEGSLDSDIRLLRSGHVFSVARGLWENFQRLKVSH